MEISIHELFELAQNKDPEPIMTSGEKVFIRTVTHYWTGRVIKQVGAFVFLEDAAWIADTGRFHDALTKHEFNEVEPVNGVVRVNLESTTDICEWTGTLPREQR